MSSCTKIFQNRSTSHFLFLFENFIKMTTKIKAARFLNFYPKSTDIIMSIHFDNLLLQLKSDTNSTIAPNQFKMRDKFVPKPVWLIIHFFMHFLRYIFYITNHIFQAFTQNRSSWLPCQHVKMTCGTFTM